MENHICDRESQGSPEGSREALLEAALEVSGARGYRALTVEQLVAVAGTTTMRFEELFDDVEDCYAAAYEAWAMAFGAGLFRACREHAGPAGLRAAIEYVVRYADDEPASARGAIGEAPAAGGRVQVARQELLERLSRAIDEVRDATDQARPSPPPVTAAFIVGGVAWAIESTMRGTEPVSLGDKAADLVFFVVLPFFGEEAAWRERAAIESA